MYQDLDIQGFQEQFANKPDADFVLIDVREVEEFEGGHLPGAINIPLNSVPGHLSEIPTDKPVVLVCARGGRSAMAADYLAGNGYENLYNLEGGTLAWMARGLPME